MYYQNQSILLASKHEKEKAISELIGRGIKNIAVACPSFTVDCLETLEEIGIHLRQLWVDLGGKEFVLVPCLNTNKLWVDALSKLIKIEA